MPFIVHPISLRRASRRRTTRCELKSEPALSAKSSALPKTSVKTKRPPAKHYRVLPEGISEDARPPSPLEHVGIPLLGIVFEALMDYQCMEKRARQFGDVYYTNIMSGRKVFVAHHGAATEILRDAHVFRSADAFPNLKHMFGESTPTVLDGAQHTAARRLLSGVLSPRLFESYMPTLRKSFKYTLERAREKSQHGRVIFDPLIREAFLGSMVEISAGLCIEDDRAAYIRQRFARVLNAFVGPTFGPVFRSGIKACEDTIDMLAEILKKTLVDHADTIERLRSMDDEKLAVHGVQEIAKLGGNGLILSAARSGLRTGPRQTHDESVVRNVCRSLIGLWFAGYATAAATTCSAIFEAGFNKDIWNQLVAEQDALVEASEGEKDLQYEQLAHMPLLDSFIMEMLRYHPVALGVSRVTNRDVEILGKFVPANTHVFVDIRTCMHDERFYTNASTMDIQRFMKKENRPMPPKVLTFGGPSSPHHCQGAWLAKVQMKTFLGTLLREYTLQLDPNQSRKFRIIPEEAPWSGVKVSKFEKRA